MNNLTTWYQRLAAITGLGYPGFPQINRARLPNANASLQGDQWVNGWRRLATAPVTIHIEALYAEEAKADWQRLRQQLREALELPGTAADYFEALTRATSILSNVRDGGDADMWRTTERIARLTLRLLLLLPDESLARRVQLGHQPPFSVHAISTLRLLLDRTGRLHELMAIGDSLTAANVPVRFFQAKERELLLGRIARMDAEAS